MRDYFLLFSSFFPKLFWACQAPSHTGSGGSWGVLEWAGVSQSTALGVNMTGLNKYKTRIIILFEKMGEDIGRTNRQFCILLCLYEPKLWIPNICCCRRRTQRVCRMGSSTGPLVCLFSWLKAVSRYENAEQLTVNYLQLIFYRISPPFLSCFELVRPYSDWSRRIQWCYGVGGCRPIYCLGITQATENKHKSRIKIRETLTLLTCADSSTDTI